jgi:hypothetical protein
MLKREKIEELIDNLNDWEVVEIAYHNWIPGMADGVTVIDVRDGQVFGYSKTTGEYSMDEEYYIFLYKIDKNTDIPYDGILTYEEYYKFEKEDCDFEEFVKKENINVTERELNYLEYYYNEYLTDINYSIKCQLDEIYK